VAPPSAFPIPHDSEADMKKTLFIALVAAIMLLPVAASRADCASDITQLKARVANVSDKMRAFAVRKQLDKATEAQRTSETECLNAVSRGWKALRAPAEPPPRLPNTANVPNYSTLNVPNGNGPNGNVPNPTAPNY
jgi:hypothetical protein